MADRADVFRLGVNYWPAQSAMGWLPNHDTATVAQDFARIAAAGMDTVRIFLRWEDLQPSPTTLDARALASVVATADAAGQAGVDLIVTLFTGHMSGVNWIPGWATGGGDGDGRFRVVSGGIVQPGRQVLRNWYADDDILEAQARLADGVAAALGGHPAVWAWDLGNESSNCTVPPDRASAGRWLERMCSVLRARDDRILITVGTHMEDLEEERWLGPAEASHWCDFVCMHGYPVYAEWSAGPLDEHLVPFLAEITRWLAGETPVLFAELGQSTPPSGARASALQVEEAPAARYTGAVIDALRACGATGALLWCYADYDEALYDRPPFDLATHERTFGLWRADGTPKPAVAEITARRGRKVVSPTRPGAWLDITTVELVADRRAQLRRLYRRYLDDAGGG